MSIYFWLDKNKKSVMAIFILLNNQQLLKIPYLGYFLFQLSDYFYIGFS